MDKKENSFIGKKRSKESEIPNKFIFSKKPISLPNDISPIAFMKGDDISLPYSKSRNLINNNDNIIYDMTQLTEKELVFSESHKKADEILENINSSDREYVIEKIYKALSYDNTNNSIISKGLKKLYELKLKDDYYNLIKEYKMIISEEDIKENINYQIKEFYIPKNETELKNIFIELLKILVKLDKNDHRKISRKILKFKRQNGSLIFLENKELNNFKELLDFAYIYEKLKFNKKYFFNL